MGALVPDKSNLHLKPLSHCVLQGEEPDIATVTKLIRKGTIGNVFVPVTCGSAFKNKGVQPLLDTVCAYLPSPVEVPPMKVRQCFKTEFAWHGGEAVIYID